MKLTEKQKAKIENFDVELAIDLLYTCKERLGIHSQAEYMEVMDYPYSRQQLNNDMKSGKIKYIDWCGVRHPFINDT